MPYKNYVELYVYIFFCFVLGCLSLGMHRAGRLCFASSLARQEDELQGTKIISKKPALKKAVAEVKLSPVKVAGFVGKC